MGKSENKNRKYKCVYVPSYTRSKKEYRLTKNKEYIGYESPYKGFLIIKNDYDEYRTYGRNCFKETKEEEQA